MQINVRGKILPALVRQEEGRDIGYGGLLSLLAALGVPVIERPLNEPLVALRALADAFRDPVQYDPATNTLYLGSRPLPPLPADPVGADINPGWPVTAVIVSGPGDRRPDLLTRIIQQFRVATNPRYRRNQQGQDETYCNIFLWDVTRALGAEIPHWVVDGGTPAAPGAPGAWEMDANATIRWLRTSGPDYGWRSCKSGPALAATNAGKPAVVTWYNPGGIGHVAMVRPGAADPDRSLPIAQAGVVNFDDGYLIDGFGRAAADQVEFYVHDWHGWLQNGFLSNDVDGRK